MTLKPNRGIEKDTQCEDSFLVAEATGILFSKVGWHNNGVFDVIELSGCPPKMLPNVSALTQICGIFCCCVLQTYLCLVAQMVTLDLSNDETAQNLGCNPLCLWEPCLVCLLSNLCFLPVAVLG